jgi:hypothetical protein
VLDDVLAQGGAREGAAAEQVEGVAQRAGDAREIARRVQVAREARGGSSLRSMPSRPDASAAA